MANLQLDTSLSGYRSNRYPLIKSGSLSERSSRASSVGSIGSSTGGSTPNLIDYRTLYHQEKQENEQLAAKLKRLERLASTQQLNDVDQENGCETIVNYSPVNYDRQMLERRIMELEKLALTVEQLRLDNHRLKEENGALIRVISKLSR